MSGLLYLSCVEKFRLYKERLDDSCQTSQGHGFLSLCPSLAFVVCFHIVERGSVPSGTMSAFLQEREEKSWSKRGLGLVIHFRGT